jgi:predicted adenylyl cyclase CyaB
MTLPAARRNLEIKARLADPAAVRDAVARLGARPSARETQTDTYFRVAHGRLKLREIEGQPAVVIWYDRPDQQGTRDSAYHLVPVPDAATMKAALTAALGVRGECRKRREIYLWHNVRIHLDEVTGLGRFVEFEAVLSPQDEEEEATSRDRLEQLGRALGICASEYLATSYADLLGL